MSESQAVLDDLFVAHLPQKPYPGLRPFEQEEWPIFFGRERMIDDVIEHLLARQIVLVHGSSGSGKSSLVRAGIQARLAQSYAASRLNWRACACRPGDDPLGNLAAALAAVAPSRREVSSLNLRRALNLGRDAPEAIAVELALAPADRVCVLLDQFEELFRYSREVRSEDAKLLTDLVVRFTHNPPKQIFLLITMRSDFLGECAQFEGLAEAVNRCQYLLPRMQTTDLLRAIREPATLYNGVVTDRLAERLISDARMGDDELPLVQHGLSRLWQMEPTWDDNAFRVVLDLPKYEAHGPLDRLLSDHADRVFAAACPDAESKRAGEELFRALTDIDSEGRAVRRPQTFEELAAVCKVSPERLAMFLDQFRARDESFLTPYLPDPIHAMTRIEIGHEALIRRWAKIADAKSGWLRKEFRDGLIWRALSFQAENFAFDGKSYLSEPVTKVRGVWLRGRNPAWAERYDGGWAAIEKLVTESRKHWAREQAQADALRQKELDSQKRIADAERDARKFAEAAAREAAARAGVEANRAKAETELRATAERARNDAQTSARKLRYALATVVTVGLAALLGFGVSLYEYGRASRQLERANQALAESINNDLVV
jgi:hypothetical protein